MTGCDQRVLPTPPQWMIQQAHTIAETGANLPIIIF
jgi:hypothetical protein